MRILFTFSSVRSTILLSIRPFVNDSFANIGSSFLAILHSSKVNGIMPSGMFIILIDYLFPLDHQ